MTDHDPTSDEALEALLIDDDMEDEIDNVVIDLTAHTQPRDNPFEESLLEIEEETYELEALGVEIGETADVIEDLAQRRDQKFRAQARSKRSWTLITAGVVVGLIVFVFALLESPIYDVNKVAIKNASSVALGKDETDKITALTNKLKGQPMYRIRSEGVIKEIEKLPTITDASVSTSWPGDVTVTLTRRAPVAYVETTKGFVLVDKEGFAFEKMSSIPPSLPSFEGISEMTYTQKLSNKHYVEVLKNVPGEIINQVKQVRLDEKSYEVVLSDGIVIKLGEPTQLKEKLAIAWSIMLTKNRSELGYIDVSVPSLPVSGSPKLKV